jgi:dihydrofolate reductase
VGKVILDMAMSLDSFIAGPNDEDVVIGGGANTVQQFLKAGFIEEIQIHLVPILLGQGIRLFEHIGAGKIDLETTRVINAPDVTHLSFRVIR